MSVRKSARRRSLARDPGAPQASVVRSQRRLSRGILLTGTSVLALSLAASDGALARPFGSFATSTSAPTIAGDAATAAAQQATAVATQSQNALARATKAIQALQAAQAAARSAAQAAGASQALPQVVVPNGLAPGGLQVAPGATAGSPLWQGAALPTQSASGGQTSVTINQTAPQAILNWQTFNVGSQTTVNFNQQASTWTALNRVIGNLGPSQILGRINAPGQVLVINQNGIIFGGASQINVGSLIASTAGITDAQFLANGIYSAQSGNSYLPSFTGAGGKIIVESGALITTNAPASVTTGGGFVALLGTEVDNASAIITPKGQAMLAAGDDFILRPGYSTTANQYSTTAGNELAPVLHAGSTSGTVGNTGIIFAQQGDITLAGHAITQDGVLVSTTSVNQRGTIHLLNAANDATGSVTLTDNGISLILPELASADTALNSQRDGLIAASGVNTRAVGQFNNLSTLVDRKDQSRVEIVTGGLVDFQTGSLTMAQGGQVAVSAGKRVFAESGSTIDVSGTTGTVLAASSNSIKVNVQGNELRDSPQNRDGGALLNANVWIDARGLILVPAGTGGYSSDRYYTAGGLLEVSGYLNNTGHTIGEWTAVGGTVTLSAPEVVAQQGSIFNISGGAVQYRGGYVPQTYVLGSDGRIYNINNAPANLTYSAVANGFVVQHKQGGKVIADLTQVYLSPFGRGPVRWQDGYTQGRDAGQLILSTPTSIFGGSILADVIDGERQIAARPSGVTDGYKVTQNTAPLAGMLSLGQYNSYGLSGAYATDVIFGAVVPVTAGVSVSDAVPTDRVGTAWFDAPTLSSFGLGGLKVATGGGIAIDAPLTFAPGAQVSLTAPTVAVNAGITAHGGSVIISNILKAATGTTVLTTPDGGAQLTLAAGATIDVSGLWVNALTNPNSMSGLAFLNGGNVTFDSTQNLTLAGGSVIDVSSGGAILASGKTQGGKGGNVTIIAGHAQQSAGAAGDGTLVLNGTIRAYGVNGGGALTVSSPGNILIGDNAELAGGVLAAGTPALVAVTLKQSLTVPAGQPLPASLTLTFTTVTFGVPTPVDIKVSGDTWTRGPTGADWVNLPQGIMLQDVNGNYYSQGQTLPAGTIINFFNGTNLPKGTIIPVGVFPNGLPINPYQVTYAPGSVLATAVTYPSGYTLPAGTVLPVTVAVAPAPALNPSFFAAGFSNYDINGGRGVLVATNTALAPTMPVYRFTADSYAAPTGSDPASAMSVWTPPLFIENPASATLTQRGGASVTLRSLIRSGTNVLTDGGAVVLGDGASITVDPGQNITLDAFGQITVLGNLTARDGSITLLNEADGSAIDAARNFDVDGNGRGVSVWVGANARLDASGLAYGASDFAGHAYGQATDGGAITINGGGAFVVIRPGAVLTADGAGIGIDLAAGGSAQAVSRPLTLASNGGTISLSSQSGLYLDGDVRAASGGAGASGGSLSIALTTPIFAINSFPFDPNTWGYKIPPNAVLPSTITVMQGRPASLLPGDIAPGTHAASLAFGQATVSVDMIKAGGFDSLTLNSGDYIQFSGNVALAMGRSLTLTAAAFTSGAPVLGPIDTSTPSTSGSVKLSAPYILFREPQLAIPDGFTSGGIGNPGVAVMPTTATFEADASQIDIQGLVQFSAQARNNMLAPGFQTTRLVSQGDIRFLAMAGVVTTQFASSGDIALLAAQIYPATNASAAVIAGSGRISDTTTTLSIGRTTDTIPDAPMSVFGRLSFQAPVVEQGGIVRAPFGTLSFGTNYPATSRVDLLPGSLSSVSMAGLTIPYGGTIDGVTYTYNGTAVRISGLAGSGIILDGQSIYVAEGAILDMSGGGMLSGAGFVSGRGGSVNVLNTPLVNANPATPLSKAGNKVYAVLPGYASSYAPIAPENGAGDPVIGQQVTIPAGVPGLPAGTYTLLPSNYALLPGAYRVELGAGSTSSIGSPTAIGNGTYAVSVATGIANTTIRGSMPTTALITAGPSVRGYARYNEQSYSDFLIANVAQFGGVRPLLPVDGKVLALTFETPNIPAGGSALSFNGTALLQGAQGGNAGQVSLMNVGEIYADAPTAGFTGVSVRASDLNAIVAPRLTVNGTVVVNNGRLIFDQAYRPGGYNLFIRDGVTLTAGELFFVGNDIAVGNDVTLSTVGQGAVPFDSVSTGMSYSANGYTVLALSNGTMDFLGSNISTGSITIGAGSQLYSEGTLAFATNGASSIDPTAHFGSRNIVLAVGTVNIGDPGTIAAAGAPTGLRFDQALFNTLVSGDPLHGAPALKTITLSAAGAINLFGSTGLDATGSGVDLVLNTPAIYGYGTADDHSVIAANKITWNGIPGATVPAIVAGGPGTGSGSFALVADQIVFGRFTSLDTSSSSRVIYGFGNVDIVGRSQIVSAGNSKLFLYQAPSADPAAVFGQSGTGGNLTLATSLLTGVQKSVMAYAAGGALDVIAPAGTAPSAAHSTVSGAEIDLSGGGVTIASTILLPSGKLVVNAIDDIALAGGSRIDLAGQPSMIQKATVYGFGGTAIFNSTQGSVTQAAGAMIDVSATNANAGSVSISAGNGAVRLDGTLNGAATAGFTSGDFGVTAGTLDFVALNATLNQGGFFDARSFDLRTGDLVIGGGVKARNVMVSVDNGSLTVAGIIDASGAAPGTIRLSADNGLTLASGAVLDVHGNVLQVDSYGQPIEAKNRGHIELTAAGGKLTLSPGAIMNLTTPGGIAYGDIVLNAQRTGETSGDIAIDAAGSLTIKGAYGIALNAFWTYDLPGGSTVTQATLDGYDTASTAFINAALGNAGLVAGLPARLAGLSSYGKAFHLRPGVQITSSGDLSTSGDIDLAGYRYGSGADRNQASATYGAGEPLALVIRAAGNLTVKGSISDGFKQGIGIAPTNIVLLPSSLSTDTVHFAAQGTALWRLVAGNTVAVTAPGGWTVPTLATGAALPLPFRPQRPDGTTYASGSVIPFGTTLTRLYIPQGKEAAVTGLSLQTDPGSPAPAATSARANMLAAGSLSASIRLVAGADLVAADQRTLQTTQALGGQGNLTLSDPLYNSSSSFGTGQFFSVLRSGTGSLDLIAGGSFSESTPYGVYTAGTQSAPILTADGRNPYDLIAITSDGATHNWYPEHGGDVLLMAQQDVTGNIQMFDNTSRYVDSNLTGNWLARQGGGGLSADPTAWWINFGSYAKTSDGSGRQLIGFQGIGTLGGGNLTLIAGGNAGLTGSGSTGLDLAVASTGRVLSDGTLFQTGGGDLIVKIGGKLNSIMPSNAALWPDYFGAITDLRGNITVTAGAVGGLAPNNGSFSSYDPRAADPNVYKVALSTSGPIFTPGDGSISITTRGDLVFGGASDAGMGSSVDKNGTSYTLRNADGTITLVASGGQSNFTLWTPATVINLYSAGGDAQVQGGNATSVAGFYPGTLSVAAANGDIRVSAIAPIELAPSPFGQLELLAAGSIYGAGQVVAMSGADMSFLATPSNPAFWLNSQVSNASPTAPYRLSRSNPIAFGPDTPLTNLHADDGRPALVFAGTDIVDLTIGQVRTMTRQASSGFLPSSSTWYIAAKPFEIVAGRDIVGVGPVPDVFFNTPISSDIGRVTLIQAGRDIIYQSVTILGTGLLDVQAGRNLYQGYYGSLVSVGNVVNPADTSGGASIWVLAGVGPTGPDYAGFARLYFDPANQLPTDGTPLAGSGKVVRTYNQDLIDWLHKLFGFTGTSAEALKLFLALPSEQQGIFVRQVYFEELTAGGREETGALASPRLGSYLRGREAIAALFPNQDAQGKPIAYSGQITMFSGFAKDGSGNTYLADAGIQTQFGGDIQILNPGGQTIIGVEGVSPGAGAGLITQGSGNIDVYSLGSILLGQSRIMTTFGGNILAWSATGDINAGRGSKTTTIFTPPKRTYDNYGNVSLSPSVPSAGAGIATLNPIPAVPPGNIDLIAPLGTIDAGEAGIRVSGNINLAALQVINAANIQVQGTTTGIPTVQGPPVGALTTASNATAATQQTTVPTQSSGGQPSIVIVEVLGYGGGDPSEAPRNDDRRRNDGQQGFNEPRNPPDYSDRSAVQIAGYGQLSAAELEMLTPEERKKLSGR